MLQRINHVLNNENAGPNLEALLSIGLSLAVMQFLALPYFKDSAYQWIDNIEQIETNALGSTSG